ncbi:MAG TPA: response regulator transcription factor [Cyclobacteriaceae bacterium]|jgi:DNA-binding NarL/FixJ family response regulator|nr:response regulator transcription factor [Cyclobacteriaceae bacterium]
MDKINIVLADDHVLVRNGLKAMLDTDTGIAVVGEASNGMEALEVAKRLRPDILVLDIRMPDKTGLEAAAELKDYAPDTKAVILSMHDSEEYVLQALDAGAYGYLLKDTDKNEFVKALKQIHGGNKYFSGAVSNVLANRLLNAKPYVKNTPATDQYNLTKKEREILSMVIDGKHNKQISESLGKSARTIETHRFNIMKKMGVNNAIDMVNKAVKENLI